VIVDLAGFVYSNGETIMKFESFQDVIGDWNTAVVVRFKDPEVQLKCSGGVSFVKG
jgi:hypothetical protein